MKKYVIGNYERISKATARKMFLDGETVYLCAVNMSPVSMWQPAFGINRKDKEQFVVDEIGMDNYFKDTVNSFEYYNCDNERGRYTAFYRTVTA